MAEFEPNPRPKSISLRLVMERSLLKGELAEFDVLDTNEALVRARSLKTLHCDWSSIGEIDNLDLFEATEVLYLQHNLIQRIENLECLSRLQFLALQGNRISVVENLDCLPELEFLDLSKNRIAELDVGALPLSVNMLNLRQNPCTEVEGYKDRVRARLPDLVRLDGEDLSDGGATASAAAGASLEPVDLRAATGEAQTLLSTEQGLGAYWRKGEMQSNLESATKDRIEAFHIEALADVEGFDQQVHKATERSRARREGLGSSLGDLAASLSRPGTARLLEGGAAPARPRDEAELLS